jgi:hypothetical protein
MRLQPHCYLDTITESDVSKSTFKLWGALENRGKVASLK